MRELFKAVLLEFANQMFDKVLLICSNNSGSEASRLKSPSTRFTSKELLRSSEFEKNAGIVDNCLL